MVWRLSAGWRRRPGARTASLRTWVRQARIDAQQLPGATSEEQRRIVELEREVRELRRANEILKAASAFFARESPPAAAEMTRFIDQYRDRFGVEPICTLSQVAPSSYYVQKTRPPSNLPYGHPELILVLPVA